SAGAPRSPTALRVASSRAGRPPRRLRPPRSPSPSPPPAASEVAASKVASARAGCPPRRLLPRRRHSPLPPPAPAALPASNRDPQNRTKQGPYSDTRRRKSLRLIASSTDRREPELRRGKQQNPLASAGS
ncbi:hypothetical protein U9M48_011818, partial [Paspalum notatum var. saurae]